MTERPKLGESLPSYVLGLSHLNDLMDCNQGWGVLRMVYDGPLNMAAIFGMPRATTTRLAALAGIAADDVAALTLESRHARWSRDGGAAPEVKHCYSFGRRTRWCPVCLAQTPTTAGFPITRTPHLNWWSAYGACACPEHGVWLIDRCPDCGSISGIHDVVRGVCRCSCPFRSTVAVPVGETLLQAQAMLHAALEVSEAESTGLPRGGYLLLHARLRPVLINALRSGWQPAGVQCPEPEGHAHTGGAMPSDRGTLAEDAIASQLVHHGLTNLPDSWGEFLETCRGLPSLYTKRFGGGTHRDFGLLMGRLRSLDKQTFAPVLAATERYLRTEWTGGIRYSAPLIPLNQVGIEPTVGLEEAARRLRVSMDSVRMLVSMGHLEGKVRRAGDRWHAAIQAESIARLATQRFQPCLSTKETATALGVARQGVHALERAGLIDLLAIGRRTIPGAFTRASVERLLTAVATALVAPPIPSDATVKWSRVCRHRGVNTARVITALLEGGCSGVSGTTFRDLRLTPATAAALVARFHARPGGYLTVVEAARELHLAPTTVRHLVRDGLFPVTHDGTTVVLPQTAITRFREEYTTMAEFAREIGISRRLVRRWVRHAQLEPLWRATGGHLILFRQQHLRALTCDAGFAKPHQPER